MEKGDHVRSKINPLPRLVGGAKALVITVGRKLNAQITSGAGKIQGVT